MTLCLGIIPGGLQGLKGVLGIVPEVAACKAKMPCPLLLQTHGGLLGTTSKVSALGSLFVTECLLREAGAVAQW